MGEVSAIKFIIKTKLSTTQQPQSMKLTTYTDTMPVLIIEVFLFMPAFIKPAMMLVFFSFFLFIIISASTQKSF